jgi:hypothetical protein
MMGIIRFTLWAHRSPESIFGAASSPVNRDGVVLTFDDEGRAPRSALGLAQARGPLCSLQCRDGADGF